MKATQKFCGRAEKVLSVSSRPADWQPRFRPASMIDASLPIIGAAVIFAI
jgi:hypothetical protein